MYTVYGIYDAGSLTPIYIGCTKNLTSRIAGHSADALRANFLEQHYPERPFTKKCIAIRDARMGNRALEVRPIIRVGSKSLAYRIEKALIKALVPECNAKGLELIRKAAA